MMGGKPKPPKQVNIDLPELSLTSTATSQPLMASSKEPAASVPRDLRTGARLYSTTTQAGNSILAPRFRNGAVSIQAEADRQQRLIDETIKLKEDKLSFIQSQLTKRDSKENIAKAYEDIAKYTSIIDQARAKKPTLVSTGGQYDPVVKRLTKIVNSPVATQAQVNEAKRQLSLIPPNLLKIQSYMNMPQIQALQKIANQPSATLAQRNNALRELAKIKYTAETISAQQGLTKGQALSLGIKPKTLLGLHMAEINDKTVLRGENVTTVNLNQKGFDALAIKSRLPA